MTRPAVLVVGAGAVGQAYALALARAGAAVHFFIKPHHEARLASGMPIRERGLFRMGPSTDLSALPRIHDWAEVGARAWHSIWLAVDSTAMKGDWVRELAARRGAATVVLFQTGTSARSELDALLPPEARVAGMIPFLAWWNPLAPGGASADRPHMCVWHPPGMATPLSGAIDRVEAIAALLRAGGLRARVLANATALGAMGSAVLLPAIAGLEVHDWRLTTLTRRPNLSPVIDAIVEAQGITARLHTVRAPPAWLLQPLWIALLVRLIPTLAPLDLETYLQVHFTKVGAQTAAALAELRATALVQGVQAPALARLHNALLRTRMPGP